MTSKEYLEQIGKLEHKIKCMKDRAEYYDQMSLSIPGPCYDKIGTNGTRNLDAPFVKWLIKLDEIKREIEKKEEQLTELKAEITLQIESFENEEYKNVLLLRYFKHLGWNEIARQSYCSIASVYRYHEAALGLIRVPVKNDS